MNVARQKSDSKPVQVKNNSEKHTNKQLAILDQISCSIRFAMTPHKRLHQHNAGGGNEKAAEVGVTLLLFLVTVSASIQQVLESFLEKSEAPEEVAGS